MLSQDVGPNCAYTKWVYLTITIDKKHNSWNAEGETSTLSLTCTIYISSIFTNKYCLTNLYYKLTNTKPDEVVWFRPGIPCFGPLYECIYVCLSGCKFPVTILELKTWNSGHSILVDLEKDKLFFFIANFEGSFYPFYDCMTPSSSDDSYCLLFRHDVTSDAQYHTEKKG